MNIDIEILEELLEDNNIKASNKDIVSLRKDLELHFEMDYEMRSYSYSGSDPEKDELKKELEYHKNKRICGNCKGAGYVVENFGIRSSTSKCIYCDGGFLK
jgi:hypothetical protein